MNDKPPWPEQVTVMTLIPLNVGENFPLLILLHAHFPYQNEIQGQQLKELPVNSEIEIQGQEEIYVLSRELETATFFVMKYSCLKHKWSSFRRLKLAWLRIPVLENTEALVSKTCESK